MDDWSDGFTGIVDLDRRMRELAMSEQGLSRLDSAVDLDVYEPYSPLSPSWTESQHTHSRRKSSSDARSGSISQSSLTTGRSIPSFTSHPHATGSSSSTTATSRFSQDSRAHSSSLLAKRRSSAANTIDSFDSAHSPLRLAPLPASPSAFGNYRLTDGTSLSLAGSTKPMVTSASWSSLDEQDPLTPLAIASRNSDPITPGTAAAATWTDPTAPCYFPAGLHDPTKKKPRSLSKKAARAPLPRLVSGEVVSSPSAELQLDGQGGGGGLQLGTSTQSDAIDQDGKRDERVSAYALRRSAQSLALSFRFKMLRAKRKVKKTGQGAADLFATAGSQRSSGEGASISI